MQGNLTAVVGPRDNTIQVQVFDMVGRVHLRHGADDGYTTSAGEARVLADASGRTARATPPARPEGHAGLPQTQSSGSEPQGPDATGAA